MAGWKKIAVEIHKHYKEHDGFVILHGTDTMSFTASALSFMFHHLSKTVVLTGSQVSHVRRHDFDSSILVDMIAHDATRYDMTCSRLVSLSGDISVLFPPFAWLFLM
jgi:hypothetical protein